MEFFRYIFLMSGYLDEKISCGGAVALTQQAKSNIQEASHIPAFSQPLAAIVPLSLLNNLLHHGDGQSYGRICQEGHYRQPRNAQGKRLPDGRSSCLVSQCGRPLLRYAVICQVLVTSTSLTFSHLTGTRLVHMTRRMAREVPTAPPCVLRWSPTTAPTLVLT